MSVKEPLWETTEPVFSPKLYDHEIDQMRHIEPLLREPHTNWYRRVKDIQAIDPCGVSYLWNAEPYGGRLAFGPLERVRIMTFHTWGAPALFKPSLAEVYAAIRQFVPDWSHVRFFCLEAESMGVEHVIGSYHWCFCDLFGEPIEHAA